MAKTILKKSAQSKPQKADIDDLDLDLETSEVPTSGEVATTQPRQFKRSMTGKKKTVTDLFKLSVAKVIKYEGYDPENEHPDSHPMKFSTWEHTHPFRTYDKNGVKQTMSTPIAGHFHLVEWQEDPNGGEPTIISISGPMAMQKKKIKGRMTSVAVALNDYDDHMHDIEYLRSSEIEYTPTNTEAQIVIAREAMKTAPVPGVIG